MSTSLFPRWTTALRHQIRHHGICNSMTGAGIEPAACGLKEPVQLVLTCAARAFSAQLVPTGGQAVPSITSCPKPSRVRVPRFVPRSESPAVADRSPAVYREPSTYRATATRAHEGTEQQAGVLHGPT